MGARLTQDVLDTLAGTQEKLASDNNNITQPVGGSITLPCVQPAGTLLEEEEDDDNDNNNKTHATP